MYTNTHMGKARQHIYEEVLWKSTMHIQRLEIHAGALIHSSLDTISLILHNSIKNVNDY